MRKMLNPLAYLVLIAGLFALSLMPSRTVYAAALTVNQTGTQTDSGDGDGVCSLIDAIQVANSTTTDSDCGVGDAGSDTIILTGGSTYNLGAVNDTTDGANGLPSITSPITIEGSGATINRSGVSSYRIFHIAAGGDLTLNDVGVSNGSSTSPGGGIFNQGALALNRSTIASNISTGNGGGIYVDSGIVTITNSTMSTNTAASGGGIYVNGGAVSINAVTIANNSTGIVQSSGTVSVQSSILDNATNCGGAIGNSGDNLASDASCSGFGVSGSLNLGGLNLNPPGLTQTHMPGSGSEAIDTASSCSTTTDQRGVGRPVGANCDIGAVEVGTPGFTIDESGGVAVNEEGATSDSYIVTVNTPPTSTVMFEITADSQCTITSLNPVPVSPTTTGFNVDVQAIDDGLFESSPHTCVITHSATSADPLYNGIFIANVNVSVTDNDTPAIKIDPTTIDITEGGTNATYSIVLETQPTANVNLLIDALPVGQCLLDTLGTTFNDLNWDTPQEVSVIAVNDLVAEGTHTCTISHTASSSDSAYDDIDIDDVIATITDNDTAGIDVSTTTLTLAEGGTLQTYTLTLDTPPANIVNIEFTTSPPGECTISSDNPLEIPPNTTGPFTVEVIAVDDSVIDSNNCTISHTAISDDAAYNGIDIDDVVATITDNDSPGLAYNLPFAQITEGDPGVDYQIFLNTLPTADVNIDITTDAQCAITSTNPTTITNGTLGPATVTVVAVDDTDVEASPHPCAITHTTSSSDSLYQGIIDTNFAAEVTDNDGATISIGDTSFAETNAGTTTATFKVTLSAASAQTITVNWAIADGTATTADNDYAANSGTVAFDPGDTSKPVTVTVNGDTKFEDDETFFVNLTNPTNATILGNQGMGTITNDDSQPQINIDSPLAILETNSGQTPITFTVSLTNASSQSITVTWQTADDTATAGDSDYDAASGTVTFPANSTATQTVSVQVNGDTKFEDNETFFVNLTSPTNATIADNQGTGTINNDDSQPSISIDSPSAVMEGNSGQAPITFTVSLTNASSQSITVTWQTADDTATTADNDYDAGGPAILTFAPGAPLTQTVPIQVNGDTTPESDETFFVNLATPMNATIGTGQGTGTILDDDTAPLPTLSIDSPPAVTEGDAGTVDITFTVTLSAISTDTVTVNWSTADDTAVSGSDYSATPTLITFDPGETTQTLTVQVIGDELDEANETFFVNLANPTNAMIDIGQGAGIILDDDDPPTISINSPPAVTEGNPVIFTVSLSTASGQTVTVTWTTADDTATAGSDYTAVTTPQTLTFIPGTTTQTLPVTTTGDTIDEDNETFFVNLATPTNATIATGQGVGTITDDDPAPGITINDPSMAEGNSGTANLAFTVTLSNPSSQTVTVSWTTADGAATTADNDYVGVTSPSVLTFNPGVVTQPLNVVINGDTTVEPDENFTVNLSAPTNATITDAAGVGTILNDDALPTLSIGDATVTEGNSGQVAATFSVTLSAATPQIVTVNWATADGSATVANSDYAAASGTVTFPANDATPQTVTVQVNGDTTVEPNETFTVNLSAPTNATILDGQGTGTILNDDAALPTVNISDVSVTEGNSGQVAANFIVTISAATPQVVTVNWATADGSATVANSDYAAASGTVTFPANSTASQTVTVQVIGDTTVEPNETFTVILSTPTNATIMDGQGVGTIINDDAPPPGATITQSGGITAVTEGGATDSYTVVLNTQPAGIVNIAISTSPSGQCTVNPTSLVFNPATTPLWNVAQTVTVTAVNDTAVEGAHNCTISHAATSTDSTYNGIAISNVNVAINDNDSTSGTTAISIDDVIANEGNSGTTNFNFTLTRSGSLSGTSRVTTATADGTATLGNNDYVGKTQTITFAAGEDEKTFTVQVVGDSMIEPPELFLVNLSNVSGAIIIDNQGFGIIFDDDGTVPGTTPTVTPIPAVPPVPLCADLNGTTNPIIRAQVPAGTVTSGNVFCRVLAQNGQFVGGSPPETVGNPQVLSLGVIHAVDVYALAGGSPIIAFNNAVTVCLQGSGSMVYMDATQAPRPPVILTNATSDGTFTCANIPNAGTVVLVQSGGNLPGVSTNGGGSGGPSANLSGCVVTPTLRLNLRSVPGLDGRVLDIVPEGLALGASQRTRRWFRVSFEGHTGWIAAAYVSTNGACGE